MEKRLLIVDDEAPTRELLSLYFLKRGFRTTTASTGKEAMALIGETLFDLIILDLNLGDVNGIDLLKPIKAAHPDLPVIVFTGIYDDQSLVKKAMENGASSFITKTQPLPDMLKEIQKALG